MPKSLWSFKKCFSHKIATEGRNKAYIKWQESLLELVGLSNYEEVIAENLAYGQQRRLEIARALASNPKLLLLDEPAAGMNETETENLFDLIKKVQARGVTVLIN